MWEEILMAVIFTNGDFWIEAFSIARGNVASGGVVSSVFTLDRPGRFIAIATALDVDGLSAAALAQVGEYVLNNAGGAAFAYGDAITAIRLTRWNQNAGGVSIGAHVVIFLRK